MVAPTRSKTQELDTAISVAERILRGIFFSTMPESIRCNCMRILLYTVRVIVYLLHKWKERSTLAILQYSLLDLQPFQARKGVRGCGV